MHAGRHASWKDPGTQGLKGNCGQRGSLSFLKFFFLGGVWMIKFKAFIEFVIILLLFEVLASRHVGSQLPNQGLDQHPLQWKAKS